MDRAMFFVDGFNLYHSIKDLAIPKYKWLNIDSMCRHFLNKNLTFAGIKYFTAYSMWRPASVIKHKIYVKALESKGIDIIFGKFKIKTVCCKMCGKTFTGHEEKQTDVNIALTLFENAMNDSFDTAIIISGDTDLLPTIKCMRQQFTNKNIWFIFPINRAPEELKNNAHRYMKINTNHLQNHQFPDEIDLGGGVKLKRPPGWN